MQKKDSQAAATQQKGTLQVVLDWVLTILGALVLAVVIRTFVFEPATVQGDSMLGTLHHGDLLIASKFDYLSGTPQRFDVVVCRFPGSGETHIKRVIALPGETVELREGELFVNDEWVDQSAYDIEMDGINYGPVRIPMKTSEDSSSANCYFLVSDNRENDYDSRNPQVGTIEKKLIRGKVQFVLLPFSRTGGIQ